MLLDWIHIAQEAGAGGGGEAPSALVTFFPFIIIGVILWLLIFAPQRRQEKERKAMLGGLSKNDKVITAGGIYGTITKVKESSVLVRVSDKPEVIFEVLRTSVGRVVKSDDTKSDGAESA